MSQETAAPETADNVTGPRIVAALIDLVLLALLWLVMAALFGDFGTNEEDTFEVNLSGAAFILYVLLGLAYYFGLESSGGQTLGKKAMKLRVAAVEGSLTPGKVMVRTLLRFIDALPFLYIVGLILVAVSRKNQRLGDMAAGTIVVRA